MRPFAIQHREMPMSVISPTAIQSTVLLMRCDCGEVGTWTLAGQWTLDQVQGKTVSDLADELMRSGKWPTP